MARGGLLLAPGKDLTGVRPVRWWAPRDVWFASGVAAEKYRPPSVRPRPLARREPPRRRRNSDQRRISTMIAANKFPGPPTPLASPRKLVAPRFSAEEDAAVPSPPGETRPPAEGAAQIILSFDVEE